VKGSVLFLYALGWIAVIAIGALLPFKLIDMVNKGFELWPAVLLGIFSVVVAGVLGFFIAVFMEDALKEYGFAGDREATLYREKIRAYIARQKALLEELDEIEDVLREIRDILKVAGGD